jgi:hypothetical protein
VLEALVCDSWNRAARGCALQRPTTYNLAQL